MGVDCKSEQSMATAAQPPSPKKRRVAEEAAGLKVRLPEELVGEQKMVGGRKLPLVLQCESPGASMSDVSAWVTLEQAWLESLLREYGAVLFRGFPMRSA